MKFLAKNSQKRRLLKIKAEDFSADSRKFRKILVRIFSVILDVGLIFGAVTALRDGEMVLATILGVVALSQFGLALPKKSQKMPHWLKRLEKWGGVESVLREIHRHVDGGLPTFCVQEYEGITRLGIKENFFCIAGEWWINYANYIDKCEIVNIGEIAAIVPSRKEIGADVLTVDGAVRVGKYATHERFSEILELFLAVNPNILYEGNGLRSHDIDLSNCTEEYKQAIINKIMKCL